MTMLRGLCGDALRLCGEGAGGCCRAPLCRRQTEFERAGYALQLRVLDESELAPPTADASVVVLREPALRALAQYTQQTRLADHSVERLQAFLSHDAFESVMFHRRWASEPRLHRMRSEDFFAKAAETMGTLLPVLGVCADDDGFARAEAAARAATPLTFEAVPQALEASPYFVLQPFEEYAQLLAEAIDYLSYPLWTARKPAIGTVATLSQAWRARAHGDWAGVQALLAPFTAAHAVAPQIRLMLAEAMLENGREVEGRRLVEAVLKIAPDDAEAHLLLAAHSYRLGLTREARGILREAMTHPGSAERVRRYLADSQVDPPLLQEFSVVPPPPPPPPLGRESVIQGFRWILGRMPESEEVIDAHRVLHDDYALRQALLRSEEFQNFHRRLIEGDRPDGADSPPPDRDQMLNALFWILARPLQSREEGERLLSAPSAADLRLRLIESAEFAAEYASGSL